MTDKVLIVQRYGDPTNGAHEKACLMLACAGAQMGFDILGMHKDRFDKGLLYAAQLIIVTDLLGLHREQRSQVEAMLLDGGKPFVRCVMDLSEVEKGAVNHKIYQASKKNYFCSPQIYKTYLELDIRGDLSFLAGNGIDESWSSLPGAEKRNEQSASNARRDFWRDMDSILQQERILGGVGI